MTLKTASHLSEDDIRTKIVYEWLRDCGVTSNEINIEYSINVRLGRGIKTIHSRTDVLVRNYNGDNLMIIEVKEPTHKLNHSDKGQALSYARALAEGGIAPFTILTNGKESLLFDSVTGDEITGNIIPATHTYVREGFRVTGDALQAKAEALEFLLSLSEDNLLTFCREQVNHRMELLTLFPGDILQTVNGSISIMVFSFFPITTSCLTQDTYLSKTMERLFCRV